MKSILSIFVLLLSIASLKAQVAPTGLWNTGTDNTQVEITETAGHYVGIIKSSDNAKAEIGKQLIKDLKADGDEWKGKLYAPKKGKWFDVSLQEKGNLLVITVGSGFMSKTIKWTKV